MNLPASISPQIADLSGRVGGREMLCSSDEVAEGSGVDEAKAVDSSGGEVGVHSEDEELSCGGCEEVRQPRMPHNPGRPTKKEIAEHNVTHWPSRSWCRH